MDDESLKFVIVGHVDHGKSTLIGRLLHDTDSLPGDKIAEIRQICSSLGKEFEFGYILDNLEEERDQGITIDTTQITFGYHNRNFVIIDAPGHVEFIKNMITGASQADAAAIIIDAEEGIREQTRRHALLLNLLGNRRITILVNKMDCVGYQQERFEGIKKEFNLFLDGIQCRADHVIPISAKNGDNVVKRSGNTPWYQGPTFLEALDRTPLRQNPGTDPLRFVVQDVYNFSGRIIAGKVVRGTLRKNDEVQILPTGERTTIRSLEDYLKTPVEAPPGKCMGITTTERVFCNRGYVLADPRDTLVIAKRFQANIFWMDKEPYTKGKKVLFRCSTQKSPGHIIAIHTVIDSSSLDQTGTDVDVIHNRELARVTIETDQPVIVEEFQKTPELGRFVLLTGEVCAGGIITGVPP